MADAVENVKSTLGPTSTVAAYVFSLAGVAAAALLAFVVDHLVQTPNLTLVFVVPVIMAALSFGWGPALFSAVLSVALFDFLFVEPRMSLQVASPTDIWALALLLAVAAIASTVAAQSRRRALEAQRAAEQSEALRALAHAIIAPGAKQDLMQIAATSLGRIFDAPAVVLAERSGALRPAGTSGGAKLSAQEHEAAQWALANGKPTRAESYPFDAAAFDFWPLRTQRLVLGVKFAGRGEGRPAASERHIELVAAYLAAAPIRQV
jgi:two-component system sensor histidine kinase KdpD